MALVTVQRSPSIVSSPQSTNSNTIGVEEDDGAKTSKSLSECYFAGKGTALMLGSNERLRSSDGRRLSSNSSETSTTNQDAINSDIQQHLQSMFYLLRPEETLKMAVKLESLRAGRTRYLVVVSRPCKENGTDPEHQHQQSPGAFGTEEHTSTTSISIPTVVTSSAANAGDAAPSAASSSSSSSSTSSLSSASAPATSISTATEQNVLSLSSSTSTLAPVTTNATASTTTNVLLSSKQILPSTTSVTSTSTSSCSCNQKLSTNNSNVNINLNNNNCDEKLVISKNNMVCSKCENQLINQNNNLVLNNSMNSMNSMNDNNISNVNYKSGNTYSCINSSSNSINNNINSKNCNNNEIEESCLLGIDCNEKTTVGLVLKVLADTTIRLDGDGGFSVSVCGQQHIFKPVSVQAMWSALQTLHKVSSKAREQNFFAGGKTHDWVSYYEDHIESDRSCLNEWHAMDSLESRRPSSPNNIRNKPTEREETERVIRSALKEIMMSVDLDEVTSKYIRGRLEEYLDMDLGEFKSFIDQEMITILGQMDAPTEIFEHVYLGSEWNASNLEELQKNGVHHILNVTREIDNFFPGLFDYCNVRVYDDEKTDLLKHWDNTFKYISRAKMEGSKVLVHCKMGISRSASVVIAYAMKAYNWNFSDAMKHVKEKRTCIKPNKSFLSQLETYEGMLDAMKNKEKLQRSKSETNLKSNCSTKDARLLAGSEPTPLIQAINGYKNRLLGVSGKELKKYGKRPKSWSPEIKKEQRIIVLANKQQSLTSLENIAAQHNQVTPIELLHQQQRQKQNQLHHHHNAHQQESREPEVEDNRQNSKQDQQQTTKTMLLPCDNGQNYSVSANQIVHLQREISKSGSTEVPSVKLIITELNKKDINQNNTRSTKEDKKNLNLNLNLATTILTTPQNNELWDPGDMNASVAPAATAAVGVSCGSVSGKNNTIVNCVNNNSNSSITNETTIPTTISSSSATASTATLTTASTKFIPNVSKVLSNICINMNNNNNNSTSGSKDNNIIINTSNTISEQNDSPVWTSSAQIIHQTTNIAIPPPQSTRREGDPFSTQVDKVFDREERKHNRLSNTVNLQQPLVPPIIAELSSSDNNVSRQDSCSSIDSAIVLSYPGDHANIVSRHSSWGSGDVRTAPSRNSSWGSYDMKTINQMPLNSSQSQQQSQQSLLQSSNDADEIVMGQSGIFPYDKDEIPWHPGTVKRTKQKIEEKTTNKRICSDNRLPTQQQQPPTLLDFNQTSAKVGMNNENKLTLRCKSDEILTKSLYALPTPNVSSTSSSLPSTTKLSGSNFNNNRLSASAPETFPIDFMTTADASNKLSQRSFQYNFHQPKSDEDEGTMLGNVKNLKMNFEAKAVVNTTNNTKKKGRSLPSSPVAMHADHQPQQQSPPLQQQQQQHHHHHSSAQQPQTQTGKSVSDGGANENSFHKDALEDINVRGLVNKYEVTKERTSNSLRLNRNSNKQNYSNICNNRQRPHSINITTMPISTTTSKPLMINHSTVLPRNEDSRRPPVRPNSFNSNTISIKNAISLGGHHHHHHHHHGSGVVVGGKKLNAKSEFSKTHPMAHLSMSKQSLNTTTYNTM